MRSDKPTIFKSSIARVRISVLFLLVPSIAAQRFRLHQVWHQVEGLKTNPTLFLRILYRSFRVLLYVYSSSKICRCLVCLGNPEGSVCCFDSS
jgi:hypothetical protein